MAAPELYERAAMSMGAISLVGLIFGALVAIGLYLTYVGWLAKSVPLPRSAIPRVVGRGRSPSSRSLQFSGRAL
jgi:hypothetical protein